MSTSTDILIAVKTPINFIVSLVEKMFAIVRIVALSTIGKLIKQRQYKKHSLCNLHAHPLSTQFDL
jgi:hypothetical protein